MSAKASANDDGIDDNAAVVALRPYSIGTAARLAGLDPEIVRMWERRYHLITPERTPGGHRLYSIDDVRVLLAAKNRVAQGMRISAVAKLSRDVLLKEAPALDTPAPPTLLAERDALIDEILLAASAYDHERTAALLDRPALMIDAAQVIAELYLPLLRRVGDLWMRGVLPIAVEHFVERLITARLHALLASTPSSHTGRLCVLACLPGERHEAALLAAAFFLRRGGFDVALLGADLPIDEIQAALAWTAPALLLLAATLPPPTPVLLALKVALTREDIAHIPVLVGGQSARAVVQQLGDKARIAADVAHVAMDATAAIMRSA